MSENKEAQYREDFCSAYYFSEELLKYQLHTNTLVVEKYNGYLAGRKKGEKEIIELKKEIEELKSHKQYKVDMITLIRLKEDENQKLRELVIGFYDGEFGINTFISKAEEILK